MCTEGIRPPSPMAQNDMFSEVRHRWLFLSRYLRDPQTVGAVRPSSRALAQALCEPFSRAARPTRVLEVGAGTGAVTRYLGTILGAADELDICEVDADFARILKQDVLTRVDFVQAVRGGRVRLLQCPIQELMLEDEYDFVISGLPLTAFELRDVRDVFTVIRRCLKPGGILSYFEYLGLRSVSRLLALGSRRQRIRMVSAYLTEHIDRHQFDARTVLWNFPPARARHMRFDDC